MRSPKLFILSATMLTALSASSLSFADDTPTASAPATTPTAATPQSSVAPAAPTSPASTTTTTSADSDSSAARAAASSNADTVTLYDRRTPNRAYLIGGGALLVGTYATTAAFAGVNGPESDKDLYIPVAGPWINIANRKCVGECTHETRDVVLIAGSGVLQGVGAALVLTSFFVPEKVPTARITAGPVKMQVTPTAGMGAGGVGAFGTF